jgi:transposase-like protein
VEEQAAAELVRLAKEQGLSLVGPDGLLKQLTKTVLETALGEEMTGHLGYEKRDPAGAGAANIRNGNRAKTVLTDNAGEVQIDVPRDRAGTFAPQIVKKRQRLWGATTASPRLTWADATLGHGVRHDRYSCRYACSTS